MRMNWLRGMGLWMAVLCFGLGSVGAAQEAEAPPEDRGKACLSTEDCPGPLVCSTERGVCNPPPGCDPSREICAAVCYGLCEPPGGRPPAERCGEAVCTPGTYCCNPLRSLCVPEGHVCIQSGAETQDGEDGPAP